MPNIYVYLRACLIKSEYYCACWKKRLVHATKHFYVSILQRICTILGNLSNGAQCCSLCSLDFSSYFYFVESKVRTNCSLIIFLDGFLKVIFMVTFLLHSILLRPSVLPKVSLILILQAHWYQACLFSAVDFLFLGIDSSWRIRRCVILELEMKQQK